MSAGATFALRTVMSLPCAFARVASDMTQSDFTDAGDQITMAALAAFSSRRMTSRKVSPETRLVSHQTV